MLVLPTGVPIAFTSDLGSVSTSASHGDGSERSECQTRLGVEENHTSLASSSTPLACCDMCALGSEKPHPAGHDCCEQRGSHPGGLGIAKQAGKPDTTWTDVTLVSTRDIGDQVGGLVDQQI